MVGQEKIGRDTGGEGKKNHYDFQSVRKIKIACRCHLMLTSYNLKKEGKCLMYSDLLKFNLFRLQPHTIISFCDILCERPRKQST